MAMMPPVLAIARPIIGIIIVALLAIARIIDRLVIYRLIIDWPVIGIMISAIRIPVIYRCAETY
jgi:hypothetical protein